MGEMQGGREAGGEGRQAASEAGKAAAVVMKHRWRRRRRCEMMETRMRWDGVGGGVGGGKVVMNESKVVLMAR